MLRRIILKGSDIAAVYFTLLCQYEVDLNLNCGRSHAVHRDSQMRSSDVGLSLIYICTRKNTVHRICILHIY